MRDFKTHREQYLLTQHNLKRTRYRKVNDEAAVCEGSMITVFYDGKCGLCSREINYYRNIAQRGVFEWRDVTEHAGELEKHGISLVEGLKQMRAVDADGQWHAGADAFILIWRQLSRWRVLAVIVALPIVRQVANLVYWLWAAWRFRRLKHCQLTIAEDPEC